MDDLVQWLGAQLDEDERIARAATAGPWSRMGQRVLDPSPPSDRLGVGMAVGHAAASADFNETADHIAAWDPARVLREIDAKRRLLDLHGLVHRDVYWLAEDGEEETDEIPVCGHCVPRHSYLPHHSKVPEGVCDTVRLLALSYADRPGYREEWRP